MVRLPNEQIFQRFDAATDLLQDGRPLLSALNNPLPGPYALFHHLGHTRERTRDVRLLVVRLIKATDAYLETRAKAPGEAEQIRRELKVDYEGMFHFGSVLLDQFAYACLYLAGVPAPADVQHPFHHLAGLVEREPLPVALRPIRERLLRHTRWLYFWMRTYRNRFVVHTDHPVQLSTVSRGESFCLFTPTAVGWNDDDAIEAEMRDLLPHAPEWLQRAEPGYWERARPPALFQRVIENIGSIDRQVDRERIGNLAKRAGLETPTFQVTASVLADFIAEGTSSVQAAALTAPEAINIGRSPHA